jgi:cytoskeletal protein CcmA (bactofilin family)
MAGYSRQSVADIINGANITAPPLNAEFNQLAAAFNGTTGHTHDGGSGNAPKIDLTTSITNYLPAINGGVGGRNNVSAVTNPTAASDGTAGYAAGSLWVNTLSGRVYLCVANAAGAAVWVEALGILNASTIAPQITATVDFGTSTFKFRNAHFSGTVNTGAVLASSLDADTLTVNTTSTFTGLPTFNGGITVNGVSNLNGNVTITGNTQLGDAATDTINFVGRVASPIVPSTDDTRDLGAPTLEFRDLYIDGTANIDSLVADTAAITGGTINGAIIGNSVAAAITGTLITATTGFSGPLTGAVTGNVTGNLTGNVTGAVTGNVTGNLTGNVTASTGTSTFNNVTISGTLNMDAGTTSTITGLSAPVAATDATTKAYVDAADALKLNLTGGTLSGTLSMGTNKITSLGTPTANADAATKLYVDSSIANLVSSAPGTLDTLNELAAALGNDPNFATTVTNEIATKVSKAGDTMTGPLAMSSQKITGLGAPTLAGDATTKSYVDTADALKLNLSGGTLTGALAMSSNKITGLGTPTVGTDATTKTYVDDAVALKVNKAGDTMSGNLAMGGNKVTGLGAPSADADATTKLYVDGILGSATAAATSAAAASVSASNAASSASAAATSASNAAASYDQFDDRYLGNKTANPTLDNDGNALLGGALYFNTVSNEMRVWNGTAWQSASIVGGTVTSLNTTGTLSEAGSPVVVQSDIGTAPNEIPLNQYLGSMAYQDAENVIMGKGTFTGDVLIQHAVNSGNVNLNVVNTGTAARAQIVAATPTYNGGFVSEEANARTLFFTNGKMSFATGSSYLTRAEILDTGEFGIYAGARVNFISTFNTDPLVFRIGTANVEAARITPNGDLFVGSTSGTERIRATVSGQQVGIAVFNTNRASNDHLLYAGVANGVDQFWVVGDSQVLTRLGVYGTLSDRKLKENITDATPKLEKLCQVRVVNFNLKGDETRQLGVIAQEVEQLWPGLVSEAVDKDAEGNDLGTTTKSVKMSVFVPMLIKAIQEQQTMITAQSALITNQQAALTQLQADVAALQGTV